jgi:Tfp pilus assembly protein PilZ
MADTRGAAVSLPHGEGSDVRVLQVNYASSEEFEHEYTSNLVSGGIFISTEEPVELRELVHVKLVLDFCGEEVRLPGEVVHVVTPGMASMGGTVGVAVQVDAPAAELRERLEPLLAAQGISAERPVDDGRRAAPRVEARVPALIEGADEALEGHTRDLSQVGVMVMVPGRSLPVGETVQVTLTHPESGETMNIEGKVAREMETDGGGSALGIRFDPSEEEREAVESFVEDVQSAEHARRMGGITGDIASLSATEIVQMFGTTANRGTLTLRQGQREGIIGFEGGLLRYVRLGTTTGMKALLRLLGWTEGSFEFHARLDPVDQPEAPLPLEAALIDAVRRLDEFRGMDLSRFPADAQPSVQEDAPDDDLTKLESAVLDLVRAGLSVGRIIEVIPEPDPEVYCALDLLLDRSLIAF